MLLPSRTMAGPGGFCLGHTSVLRAGLIWSLPTDLNHALRGTEGCHPKEEGGGHSLFSVIILLLQLWPLHWERIGGNKGKNKKKCD